MNENISKQDNDKNNNNSYNDITHKNTYISSSFSSLELLKKKIKNHFSTICQ